MRLFRPNEPSTSFTPDQSSIFQPYQTTALISKYELISDGMTKGLLAKCRTDTRCFLRMICILN